MTTAELGGYFPLEFPQQGPGKDRVAVGQKADGTVENHGEGPVSYPVHDARPFFKADSPDFGALECFKARGFALLPHETKVKDWNEDYMLGMFNPLRNNDIKHKYAPEIEYIIRNVLLPDYHCLDVQCHGAVLKRGPGSKNNFYGTGVHQDYGMVPEDMHDSLQCFGGDWTVKNFDKWYDKEECTGVMVINFWRPIDLSAPLTDKPLAVCDPHTVKTADLVFTGMDAKNNVLSDIYVYIYMDCGLF